MSELKSDEKRCIWTPEVRDSGRVSTLFYHTTCGHVLAKPTDPIYCFKCGRAVQLVSRQFAKGAAA